jgi:hypothetical protein
VTDTPATKHRITLLEWVGVGAGALALVASFLPWYTLSGTITEDRRLLNLRTWLTAWGTGFLGWFPTVLLMSVAVLIIGQRFGKAVPILASLWMTLSLLAVVMILLRWITVPDAGALSGRGPDYATFHAGFGLYLGLLAAIIASAIGFLAFRANAKKLKAETPAE